MAFDEHMLARVHWAIRVSGKGKKMRIEEVSSTAKQSRVATHTHIQGLGLAEDGSALQMAAGRDGSRGTGYGGCLSRVAAGGCFPHRERLERDGHGDGRAGNGGRLPGGFWSAELGDAPTAPVCISPMPECRMRYDQARALIIIEPDGIAARWDRSPAPWGERPKGVDSAALSSTPPPCAPDRTAAPSALPP